jgi:hypothetical protein
MPSGYVKKLADKKGVSIDKAEERWDNAKKAAEQQGQGDNYAYVTQVFKSMMGEKGMLERIEARLIAQAESIDTVTMDVPFLMRLMEKCREDIKTDIELHELLERVIAVSKKGTLTMDDYLKVDTNPPSTDEY